jgi:hypothetical protein
MALLDSMVNIDSCMSIAQLDGYEYSLLVLTQ